MNDRWQFWIDVGGTFTDCLGVDPQGNEHQTKVLSSGVVKGVGQVHASNQLTVPDFDFHCPGYWHGTSIKLFSLEKRVFATSKIQFQNDAESRFEIADHLFDQSSQEVTFELVPEFASPILAIHLLTKTPIEQRLKPCDVYLGTTRGTNALLTRTGAKTALVTSAGMRDFLRIGDQTRPHLFDLTVQKPEPLFSTAIEIQERTLVDGTVELKPESSQVRDQLQQLQSQGIQSLSICLMHAYRYPEHEQFVGEIAREVGFDDVRLSSQVSPLIEILPRGETTVLDAYLNPVLAVYLDEIQARLGTKSQLRLMTSAGALTTRSMFSGKDSVLSGPAGGVVGAAKVAQQLGFEKMLGFDMGGTSTDVSRFDGEFQLDYEARKAGVRIMAPVMSIETVAAGGGSICHFDGTRLLVGPQSAGADPGPACYGAGGPLTVTDVNLFLGRLDTKLFPFDLDISSVNNRLKEIELQLDHVGVKKTRTEIANGFLQIANHSMSMAIQRVSSARGFDPRGYLLVAFGGAAGQHCCGVADCLQMTKILLHPKASILSALGIQLSDQSSFEACPVMAELSDQAIEQTKQFAEQTADRMRNKMVGEGMKSDNLETSVSVDLRYEGTDNTINIPFSVEAIENPVEAIGNQFLDNHLKLFGYTQNRKIEIVAVRVKLFTPGRALSRSSSQSVSQLGLEAKEFHSINFAGKQISIPVFHWDYLRAGNRIEGPAMIASSMTSTIVDPGWSAKVFEDQQLILEKEKAPLESVAGENRFEIADPIELEIFNNIFQTIAENMGQMLRKTAVSVNVKQRLDFSCAVFSKKGDLVVNAPHIPVHLGAMSETVKSTIQLNPDVSSGDVFVTNDPYAGGSHLPDVTVLTAVFIESDSPEFWVASRAHHAEIGGMSPGSMPANARTLGEEGVIIRNFKLIAQGTEKFDELRNLLTDQKYPSRNPDENISDIAAQVAANQAGVSALKELVDKQSVSKVRAYMGHIQTAAETKARSLIQSLDDGQYEFQDSMDDGTRLKVRIVVEQDQIAIDFTGTDPVHAGNLNANFAIVTSAIMYVLRCLIAENIPLNAGIMAPVDVNIPECFLSPVAAVPHAQSPAVVGGNVETSQRIVDVLFGALNVAAASQGTMNNWLVGDGQFGYYETVGGGSGASLQGNGADAVHCHMSNTRLTDPEILETRYPMILREFRVRENSGGQGEFEGGDGMIREIEFQKTLTLSLLTNRRTTQPYGCKDGGKGKAGQNLLLRADGQVENLDPQSQIQVQPGDRLRLLTPGGGATGRRKSV